MPAGRGLTAVVVCALLLFAPRSLAEQKKVIKEVRLEGLRKASEQFVRFKIRSKAGEEFSREVVDNDIRNLMATGDFRNVTVAVDETPEGVVLAYVFDENPLIRDVSITGNKTVSERTLLRRMRPREKVEKPRRPPKIAVPGAPSLVGTVYDPAEVERGVSEIRDYYEKKGYFAASVRHVPEVDKETNEVTVGVEIKEGPRAFIRKVIVAGNKALPAKSVLKAVKTSGRKKILPFIFGSGKLKRYLLDEDLDRIRALYQQKGFLDVEVHGARCSKCGGIYHPLQGDPEHNVLPGTPFEELPDGWVCPNCGTAKDSFEKLGVELTVLPEGKTISIPEPTQPILDKLGPEWKVPPKKRQIDLKITLHEGPQYLAGKFSVQGNKVFSADDLLALCSLREGMPFDPFALEKDRMTIYDKYAEQGYIDAVVAFERKPGEKPHVLDVVFNVAENQQIRIGKIEITGNLVTKDKVIRREIAVNPGEVFDMRKVRTSVQRLKNLNYFGDPADPAAEGVVVYDTPTDVEGVRDLVIEVKERPTGRLWFGGGVSSIWNVFGTFEIAQSNFDWKRWRKPLLRGAGQKARLRALLGTKRTDVIFSFTEPWLFDKPLSLGLDIFRMDKRYLSREHYYDQTETGFNLRLMTRVAPATRAGITYRLEGVKLDFHEDPDDPIPKEIREALQSEMGKRTISSLAFEALRDTTDSWFMPTRGMRASGRWEVSAGFLGSAEDLYKHDYQVVQYIRLYGKKHILRLLANVAFAEEFGHSENVPIFERLFLGGPTTMRGFQYRMVGPVVVPTDEFGVLQPDEREPLGGKSLLLLSAEYNYPIYGPVRGAVFYDTGNVWENSYDIDPSDLRAGVGVGARILIPFMGAPVPINLDYGWPIDRDEWTSKSGRFNFSMGFNF